MDMKPIRIIPTGFEAPALEGMLFLVIGTGKYFKNVQDASEGMLGIVRFADNGTQAQFPWGLIDG